MLAGLRRSRKIRRDIAKTTPHVVVLYSGHSGSDTATTTRLFLESFDNVKERRRPSHQVLKLSFIFNMLCKFSIAAGNLRSCLAPSVDAGDLHCRSSHESFDM